MKVYLNGQDININWQHDAPWVEEVLQLLRDWDNATTYHIKTSGSTGTPKVISLSKNRMIASAERTIEYFNLDKEDRALLCLPVKYIAGKMMVVRAIIGQMDIVLIEPQSNPLVQLETAVDFVAMTPMQLLLAFRDCPQQIGLCRQIILGGGPVSAELQAEIDGYSGDTRFYHTYGMTETITHVAVRPLSDGGLAPFEAVGGVSFEVDGESRLIITAPHLLDDSLLTNDIVDLVDEHSFRWRGRYDHVINSGGVKIHPEEVERNLSSSITHRFFIASVADPLLGEKLIMIIEGNKDSTDLNKLRNGIRIRLTKYERPKLIYFVAKFEETPTGKVIRQVERYALADGLNLSD